MCIVCDNRKVVKHITFDSRLSISQQNNGLLFHPRFCNNLDSPHLHNMYLLDTDLRQTYIQMNLKSILLRIATDSTNYSILNIQLPTSQNHYGYIGIIHSSKSDSRYYSTLAMFTLDSNWNVSTTNILDYSFISGRSIYVAHGKYIIFTHSMLVGHEVLCQIYSDEHAGRGIAHNHAVSTFHFTESNDFDLCGYFGGVMVNGILEIIPGLKHANLYDWNGVLTSAYYSFKSINSKNYPFTLFLFPESSL